MHKLDFPVALPGQCYICGHPTRECYVDTLMNEEFYGAIIICNVCVDEMAKIVGGPNESEFVVIKNRLEALERQVYDLTVENESLRRLVDGVDLAGVSIRRNRGGARSDDEAPEEPAAELPEPIGMDEAGAPGAEDRVGTGEGAPVEPLDDEGMVLVRSDAELDAGEFRLSL